MKSHKRIGLLIHSVADGGKVGGAERFFVKFFNWLSINHPESEVVLITNRRALKNLQYLVEIPRMDKVILMPIFSNRFKIFIEGIILLLICLFKKIQIIQIVNFDKHSDNLFFLLKKGFIRNLTNIKVLATVVDCEIPYALTLRASEKHQAYVDRYSLLFSAEYLDAIVTWYSEFKTWAVQTKPFVIDIPIYQIRTRFTIPKLPTIPFEFKDNIIIWAGRMVDQKRPILFLEAIKRLKELNPEILDNWEVKVFGFGDLEKVVDSFIQKHNLKRNISIGNSNQLEEEFQKSKLFVSTQSFENYPSQAMNEAMIHGNAIIAFNLGDTKLFLNNEVNGFFPDGDSVEYLANAIQRYLKNADHKRFYLESIKVCNLIHNPENFYQKLKDIWTNVGKCN